MLAYAYILTNNKLGLPCIFYPDYFGYPANGPSYHPSDKSALKKKINQLITIHKSYILNSNTFIYLNKSGSGYANDAGTANNYILTYQIKGGTGGKDVVVAINFGGVRAQFHQQLNGLAVGTKLTDIMGVSPFLEAVVNTMENGIPNDIWIDIPARSYAVWIEGAASTLIPLHPSDLRITQVTTGGISLEWTDNSSNESGFRIERKIDESGTWSSIETVAANAVSYTDATVQPGNHYFYRVIAINDALNSSASNIADHPVNYVWTGNQGTSWTNFANWNLLSVPSVLSNVTIPGTGVTNFPVISEASTQIHNLTVEPDAIITVNPSSHLILTGSMNIEE
jgi:hypothetical protein